MVPASTAAGLLAGSLMSALLFSQLETAQLHGWGWRLPFLLAFPLGLGGVGLWLGLDGRLRSLLSIGSGQLRWLRFVKRNVSLL